jgi:hypothetical protein
VAERCTCGALPPEDARFCHKCARPLYDYLPVDTEEPPPLPAPTAAPPAPAAHISFRNGAAVRIGLLTAVLMILLNAFPLPPVLTFVRLLVLSFGGGWFAVWSWARRTRQQVSMQDGARLGWIAGIFAFLFSTALMTVVLLAISSPAMVERLREQSGSEPGTRAMIDALQHFGPDQVITGLITIFVLFTALPTIGGALSARLLNREAR